MNQNPNEKPGQQNQGGQQGGGGQQKPASRTRRPAEARARRSTDSALIFARTCVGASGVMGWGARELRPSSHPSRIAMGKARRATSLTNPRS